MGANDSKGEADCEASLSSGLEAVSHGFSFSVNGVVGLRGVTGANDAKGEAAFDVLFTSSTESPLSLAFPLVSSEGELLIGGKESKGVLGLDSIVSLESDSMFVDIA